MPRIPTLSFPRHSTYEWNMSAVDSSMVFASAAPLALAAGGVAALAGGFRTTGGTTLRAPGGGRCFRWRRSGRANRRSPFSMPKTRPARSQLRLAAATTSFTPLVALIGGQAAAGPGLAVHRALVVGDPRVAGGRSLADAARRAADRASDLELVYGSAGARRLHELFADAVLAGRIARSGRADGIALAMVAAGGRNLLLCDAGFGIGAAGFRTDRRGRTRQTGAAGRRAARSAVDRLSRSIWSGMEFACCRAGERLGEAIRLEGRSRLAWICSDRR